MMRYWVLIFALLHYSCGDDIHDEIRTHLDDLLQQEEHFQFHGKLRMPTTTMISHSCVCEKVFFEELKKMLEIVKPTDSNKQHEVILTKLLANIDLLNPPRSKDESVCKMKTVRERPSKPHKTLFFHKNIKYIQSWTECS